MLIMGLDLGQAGDYTALAIVEATPTTHHVEFPIRRYSQLTQCQVEVPERHTYAGPPVDFQVRHLERFELGTRYPRIVEHVAALFRKLPEPGVLVVDATGVGRPIVDMFTEAGLDPIGVTITSGATATWDEQTGEAHVPKGDLVTTVLVALETGRLHVAQDLPLAQTLLGELEAFGHDKSATGRDIFNARGSAHDDLVLAVAMGLWLANSVYGAPQTISSVNYEPVLI